MATLNPHFADPNLPIGPSTFMGVCSAFYCGGVGTFAAMKKPALGVVIQGMTVGAAASVMAEAFVMSWVVEQIGPDASELFLPWIQMFFRLSCGGVVVKLFRKFGNARDVGSTVISGAVASMQIFCSFDFEFTQSLKLSKIMSGDFGCDSVGCYLTLVVFMGFAAGGVVTQIKGLVIEKKQEAGNWEPENSFERITDMINSKMKIIFEFNEILQSKAKQLPPEEIADLVMKQRELLMQFSGIASVAGLILSGAAVVSEMLELGLSNSDVASSIFLSWVTILITGTGIVTVIGGVYALLAYKNKEGNLELNVKYNQKVLYITVGNLPVAFVLVVIFATTMHSKLVRAWLELEDFESMLVGNTSAEEPSGFGRRLQPLNDVADDLELARTNSTLPANELDQQQSWVNELLTTLSISLAYICITSAASAYIAAVQLGGKMFIIIKLTMFSNWMLLVYGMLVMFAAHELDGDSALNFGGEVNPFNLMMVSGGVMSIQSLVGLVGVSADLIGVRMSRIILRVQNCSLILTLMVNVLVITLGCMLAMNWNIETFEDIGLHEGGALEGFHTAIGTMPKEDLVAYINGSWWVFLICGIVIIVILGLTFTGSSWLAKNITQFDNVAEALEKDKAEQLEKATENAKKKTDRAMRMDCPNCGGEGWVVDPDKKAKADAALKADEDEKMEDNRIDDKHRTPDGNGIKGKNSMATTEKAEEEEESEPLLPWTEETVEAASKDELVKFMQNKCQPDFVEKHQLSGNEKVVKKYVKKLKLAVLQDAYREVLALGDVDNALLLVVEPELEPKPEPALVSNECRAI